MPSEFNTKSIAADVAPVVNCSRKPDRVPSPGRDNVPLTLQIGIGTKSCETTGTNSQESSMQTIKLRAISNSSSNLSIVYLKVQVQYEKRVKR